MPTYEYRCEKCGYKFTRFQRIVDEPVRNCPKCERTNCVVRLISGGSGLLFKGSGFYITDYKRRESGEGEKTTGPAGDKGTEKKNKETKNLP